MSNSLRTNRVWSSLAVAAGIALLSGALAAACPFCSVESQTLSEETDAADAVVLAKLIKEAPPPMSVDDGFAGADANTGTAKFEIVEFLRGKEALAGEKEIDVVYYGEPDRDQIFLITGIGTEAIDWITPLPLSAEAVEYSRKLSTLAKTGADRLAFFQEYLEHEDPLLAQDAYDEFARAPYTDIQALAPRMHHDRIVKWIVDPEVSPSRRRLYFTMLGVCGTKDDVPLLEKLIVSDYATKQPFVENLVETSVALGGPVGLPAWIELVKLDERRKKLGLDALVACYLTLRGPDGLDLIDKQFLKNPNAEYTHTYSTVMALRFHGDEGTSVVPRERLLASMRLLLDDPDFVDQVPIDLARWEDWSVLDRLVAMFKAADKTGYIRPPVVSYLLVASDQPGDVGTRAKAALAELEQLDPEGVKQARSLAAFGALGRARAEKSTTVETIAAADSSAGFGATAEDLEAAAESEPADIPEPSEFGADSATTTASEPQPDLPAGESEKSTDSVSKAGAAPAEKAVSSPAPAAQSSSPEYDVYIAEPNRGLIIGLPLVAAVLLIGLYWVILRFGAV